VIEKEYYLEHATHASICFFYGYWRIGKKFEVQESMGVDAGNNDMFTAVAFVVANKTVLPALSAY
jgi:hypothetical protein